MTKQASGNLFAARIEQLKQTSGQSSTGVTIKPTTKSWEELLDVLEPVLNKPGLYRDLILKTIKELYDQGYSAELETAAELALRNDVKSPVHYFTRMVSKRGGNWATKTLDMVHKVWEVRKNALEAMEQLKIDPKLTNYMLSLSWRFKGSFARFLGMATEKGYGITNPAGYFFGIIKNIQHPKAAS